MTDYHVSDTPSEGYLVVDGLVTPGTAVYALERARYRVVRVNLSTGRGTVRHIHTNKALQVVRGRFGMWSLADGTRRLVRFIATSDIPEMDGSTTIGAPHADLALLGDIARPMLPDQGDEYVWEVTEVAESGKWVVIRRTDDRSYCQTVYLDSAGCWRLTDTTRIWFVTPIDRQPDAASGRITYADMRTRKGLTSWTLREDGWMVATLFCWDGEWSSAYDEDGTHPNRQSLVNQLLSAESRQLRHRRLEKHGLTDSENRYVLQTVADVPFGYYPDWDHGGPALVVVDGWGTSLSHGDGIDGYRINAYRVPYTGERHALDGTCYPTRSEADKAKYDAGLIAYMVYTNRTYPVA